MPNQRKGNVHVKYNMWATIRDVTLSSINKGQLPLLSIASIFVILVLKMPSEDTTKFAFELVGFFKSIYYIGWIMAVLCAFGWVYSSKRSRRKNYEEIKRMAEQKVKAQRSKTKTKLGSSNK